MTVAEQFSPGSAVVGGALIGLAATLLLVGHGKVAGISGIVAGALHPPARDRAWGYFFLGGLVAAGLLAGSVLPPAPATEAGRLAPPLIVLAGLLVGLGARLSNGCTSGHGVCGMSRGSVRSLVATITFLSTAIAAVFVVRHLLGGES